ncbi:tRNA (guanine(46)-N(7))-methyltransferase TrmB [Amaricoccus solimangrovi]|uniref:tRNA (guanine-N(7)-)-methyltransferase n=1 Tax=Amaricoccus solimangrovi TaxID=2589815 RepID=A0A501WQ35_9RHOB|nr:tRNA (guanine(46)-N(7))-methyltransferase TrmB [Amaricoccus solimangrovi]TPE50214.1 tRNA (guanosine(46)-N7)-methyltransferase TrmB [Amaricoccus solimangrovi]
MSEITTGAVRPRRDFYGRRHGKSLRPNQRRHLAELLPRLAVPLGTAPIDPSALFGGPRPVWLEIGFGGGEHLVHQALANPGVGLIGCEAFVNGVAMALNQIEEAGIEPAGIKRPAAAGGDAPPSGNVRLHAGDARDLLDALPDGCLDRVFLLYPDPWPKARHARRRFTSVENLTVLARVMKPGAELRVATDIPAYVEHTREAVAEVAALFETVARDSSAPWPDWHRTRYEAKAIREGRAPNYLSFIRRG